VAIWAAVQYLSIENLEIIDAGVYSENLGSILWLTEGLVFEARNLTFVNCFNPEIESK